MSSEHNTNFEQMANLACQASSNNPSDIPVQAQSAITADNTPSGVSSERSSAGTSNSNSRDAMEIRETIHGRDDPTNASRIVNDIREYRNYRMNATNLTSVAPAATVDGIVRENDPRKTISKYGAGSVFVSNTFTPDSSIIPAKEVNWFRTLSRYMGGGPVNIRDGGAANPGGVRITSNVRILTELSQGIVANREQQIRRAAIALDDELTFNIRFSNPHLLRDGSTAYITEFRCLADSTDYRAVIQVLQAVYRMERAMATAIAYSMVSGLAYYDSTSWYAKLWLLFFHLQWGMAHERPMAHVAIENDICEIASLRPPAPDVQEHAGRISESIINGDLIIFDNQCTARDRVVYWLAANGLPRFASPAREPGMACLLDGLTVPPNRLLFIFEEQAVIPAAANVWPEDVIHAIASLVGARSEAHFAVAGFIRASCYYNRFRGLGVRGARQAYSALGEWRSAVWPRPLFSNSLLINLHRYIVPVMEWALPEFSALLVGSAHIVEQSSVYLALSVALSYSTTLNLANVTGMDLSNVYRHHAPGEWRQLDTFISSRAVAGNGRILPMFSVAAASLRQQMGFPSLGWLAFMSESWSDIAVTVAGRLTGDNAWAAAWPTTVPYLVDPTTLLWLCKEYCALWGIVRAPCSFRIGDELMPGLSFREEVFAPFRGDSQLLDADLSLSIPVCSSYMPLLLNILMQGMRTLLPAPSGWVNLLNKGWTITLPNHDASIPGLEILDDIFLIRPGSLPTYNWRAGCITVPYWQRRNVPDSIWARISSPGILFSPTAGIEPTDRMPLDAGPAIGIPMPQMVYDADIVPI